MARTRQRRRSWSRHLIRLVILLIVGVVIGTGVAIANFDKEMYDRLIADEVEAALGRRLEIDGDISISLSLEPRITATQVRLANPSWAQSADFLKISSIDTKIALLPLFVGNLNIIDLSMDQVDADFEVSADGDATWNLESDSDGSGGSGSIALNLPDDVAIKRLNVTYSDHATGDALQGFFDDVDVASTQNNLDIKTTGQISDTPVTVDLSLPSLDAIIDPDLTTPIKGSVSAMDVDLTIDGTVGLDDAGTPTGSAEVTIDSNDISNVATLLGIDVPAEPFQFNGTAALDGQTITAKGKADVTDTTATIDTQVDTSTTPYTITGSASISGTDTAWLAKLATISIPSDAYTIDATFTLGDNLKAQGNATLGDMKAQFDMSDASWDGIPPQSVVLSLDGPDLSVLGDWLGLAMPAVAFQLSMNGSQQDSQFDITDAVVTSDQTKVQFNVSLGNLSDPMTDPLDLDASTDDLGAVGDLFEIDLPNLPFQISTILTEDGDITKLGSLKFSIGGQDLAGSLAFDESQDRLAISGNLTTDALDVAKVADAFSGPDIAEDEPLIIPDPGIDIDVTLTSTKVVFEDAEFENVDLRVRTDDKHVGLYGLTAVFAGGQLTSDFTIAHGVQNPPSTAA